MISLPRLHATSPTAALVRVAALLLSIASMVFIPWIIFGAATHQIGMPTAAMTTAILAAPTLLAILAVRSLDPLRA